MANLKRSEGLAWKLFLLCGAPTLLFPAPLRGQSIAREALSSFPDDTQQLAYTNLPGLRSAPNYPKIRQRLLGPQLRAFQNFLLSIGIDLDKDIDEVVLAWRGSPSDPANFFGLAQGNFQPERARQFFAKNHLPSQQYSDLDLYASGSGKGGADLLFAFLSSSLAAFGHLNDLKTLLDVRSGTRLALNSNPSVVGWETELEGTAPQWGILTGHGAIDFAAPWLSGGEKLPVDPSAALGPVQTVLYRIDWNGGFYTRLSILCQTAESATALGKLLMLWRDSQQNMAPSSSPNIVSSLAELDVDTHGSRIELSARGPIEALDQLFRTH